MTAEIVERIRRSSRYRAVDPALVARLASEELPKARNVDDAVKRVKRRLHQVVGAFLSGRAAPPDAWPAGDPAALREACLVALRGHVSTRERAPHLGAFYAGIWDRTGVPRRVLDLGCGLNPLALPWMGIGNAAYHAVDVDSATLGVSRGFLEAVGQPHVAEVRDLVTQAPVESAEVALLLKLVTTLDRQDAHAAARLLRGLQVRHAVVSFAARSLGGRANHERTYRARLDRLVGESGRVRGVAEASVPGELVFVLDMEPVAPDG
jgi:16S rRNA (guanine(1405)-N(7))-methyltransferase